MREVVAVLRGGPSSEYEVSLKSGAAVLQELDKERYEPLDIFISKEGRWHRHGREMEPERALRGVDVVWNALHGEYGEGGEVQRLLDAYGISYTGAGAIPTKLAFNKLHTKQVLQKAGIRTAKHLRLHREKDMNQARLLEIFRTFPHPSVIKPMCAGSSIGITLAKDFYTLATGLDKAFELSPDIFIEEYIKGREGTVGVVEEFRGEPTYALLPIEIVPPPTSSLFDYEAKYSGKSQEICPGRFTEEEKSSLMKAARIAHEELGLSHYSRSDFIVSPRGIYFLEVNSAAAIGLAPESLMPKALRAVGSSLKDFIHHVLTLAKRKR